MPSDSPKDTRLSPIVALFRGVILSGFRVVFRDLNPTKSGQVRGLVGAGWPKLEPLQGYRVGVRGWQVGGSVGRSGIGSGFGSRLIPCRPSKGSGVESGWLAGWLAWSGYLLRYGLRVRASRK